jgi:ribosomal protein L12E/L44/L45/RPP1/RPP2
MPSKNITSARHVHAVLAAAVDDPSLLLRLQRQSGKAGAKDAALDFDRVRLFAGLAVKVRQNDVRLSLPLTFKLLDLLKISIELFASYAKQAAALRKANKKSRADKIQSIGEFLDAWLDRENPDQALVHDIRRHECALTDLRDRAAAMPGRPSGVNDAKVTPKSAPWRDERLIHYEMSCNPLELERQLRSRHCDLSTIRRGQFYYIYRWDDLRACVSADEVDELGYVLIDLANGKRSVARMTAFLRRAGVVVDSESLCAAVQDLVDKDILTQKA